jgi:hypothetical protein
MPSGGSGFCHYPGRCVFPHGEPFDNGPCSKKDDKLLYKKRYKIIVGSATDKKESLLYCNKGDVL